VVSNLSIKLELAQRSTFKKSVMVKCIGESRKTLPGELISSIGWEG